jgi:hypothetical protein
MILDGNIVLEKQVSVIIGNIFVYDWYTVLVLAILSVSMETCVWNKCCVLYLAINIMERNYFVQVEMYEEYIYAVCVANIIVIAFLLQKGIRAYFT